MNRFFAFALCGMATAAAMAAPSERNFTYVPAGADLAYWGTERAETYDVAIRLADPGLVGKQVLGFTLPMNTDENLSAYTGWLSKELALGDDKKNAPDICSVDATLNAGGAEEAPYFTVTFAEPYTITSEGVYVGITFTVDEAKTEATKNPLLLAVSDTPDGFYMHTSRKYRKWKDMGAELGAVSSMSVLLSGEFPEVSANVSNLKKIYATAGQECGVPGTITNYGADPINSVAFSYTIDGGAEQSGVLTLDTPIPASFGSAMRVNFPITMPEEYGTYNLTVKITEINGQPNGGDFQAAAGQVVVIAFVPVNRPLMEEYTGFWCGYCPRGFIALERMKAKYGNDFVAISFHQGDEIAYVSESNWVNNVTGLPAAFLNRQYDVDPYYGATNKDFGIDDTWNDLRLEFAPAEINAVASFKEEDSEKNDLIVGVTTKFLENHWQDDYRLSFALVGDGMTNPDWNQHSYFGANEGDGNPDWDPFLGNGNVKGLTFNDVALIYDNEKGIEGTIPTWIEPNKEYNYYFHFDLTALPTRAAQVAGIKDGFANWEEMEAYNHLSKDKLRVVVVLTDANTGAVINSVSTAYPVVSSVKDLQIDENATVVETLYYDMQGRRVSEPVKGGLYIKSNRFSNGAVRNVKVLGK